jgi:hypothetical protein
MEVTYGKYKATLGVSWGGVFYGGVFSLVYFVIGLITRWSYKKSTVGEVISQGQLS